MCLRRGQKPPKHLHFESIPTLFLHLINNISFNLPRKLYLPYADPRVLTLIPACTPNDSNPALGHFSQLWGRGVLSPNPNVSYDMYALARSVLADPVRGLILCGRERRSLSGTNACRPRSVSPCMNACKAALSAFAV